ncbi:SPFH domain-containing protein [Pendulispora albinea]|uniref:SPFH domain-containing protein n=1 Tax=Pendulispora albinea TaxID=2741071 RepID=A0ABZ2LY75_9BACT
MELIALLMLAPIVGLYLVSGLRQIHQWEAPLKFTVGRYAGRLEPGLTWIIPGVQRIIRVDTRIRNKDLFQQQVITADNVTASIDAVIYYKVIDPEKAVLNVQDYDHAVRDRAKVVLRDIVGETRLDDLLAHREEIALKVRKAVEQFVSQWGLHVEAIAMQDIQLPQQMQEVIARVAIAERDRQYVVIKSRADVESAKNFAQAAEILASSPGAMELRRLEALQNMSGRTSRVIFDLAKPYETSRTRVAATAMALGEGQAPHGEEDEAGQEEVAAPSHESQARRAAR